MKCNFQIFVAWVAISVPFIEDAMIFDGKMDVWTSSSDLLYLRAGDWEEHAVLLCNYFLYLESEVSNVLSTRFIVFSNLISRLFFASIFLMRMFCDDATWCSLGLVRLRHTAAWDELFQMVMWCLCYKGTAKRTPSQCGIPEMVR